MIGTSTVSLAGGLEFDWTGGIEARTQNASARLPGRYVRSPITN